MFQSEEYVMTNEFCVKTILEIWLKQNGYDGLISDIQDCTCNLEDIAHCGDPMVFCVAIKNDSKEDNK